MEQLPELQLPPTVIRPPAPGSGPDAPQWPIQLPRTREQPRQIRVPIKPEYVYRFEPGTYGNPAARHARPESTGPVRWQEPGYVGRHRSDVHIAGHRWDDKMAAQKAEPYTGRHRLEDRRPPNTTPEQWAALDDTGRRRLVPPVWLAAAAVPAAVQPEPAPESGPAGAGEPLLVEGQGDTAASGLPGGVRGRWREAKAWMAYQQDRVRNYFADPEKGGNRKAAAVLLGGAAVIAAAVGVYLAARGHGVTHHPAIDDGGNRPSGGMPTHPPPTGPSEVLPAMPVSLGHHGDTIWGQVVSYANSHGVTLREADKQRLVGEVLQANGQTWDSARHLPVGYHFFIPTRVQRQILNTR